MPRQLLNPYGVKTDSLVRVQTWVSQVDRDCFRSVASIPGFEAFAFALYYQSLTKLITDFHLTYADRPKLQSYIESLPALIQASGERYFTHDIGGANTPHQHPASEPDQPADHVEVAPGGGFGRGGKRANPTAKGAGVAPSKSSQASSGT